MKRPLIIGLLIVALTLVCMGIAASIFFGLNNGFANNNPFDQRNISSQLEEKKTLKVDAEEPITLTAASDAGNVSVTGADVNTVQVKVVKTAYDSSQARADAELKGIQYTIDQDGNDITLKYELPKSMNFSNKVNTVDFMVTVPKTTSVKVEGNSGNIDVSNLTGALDLGTDFGITTVDNIQGPVTVDSQSGSITLSQVDAGKQAIGLATDFGEVTVEKINGQSLNIDSQSGALKLKDVRLAGDLVASTDFGDITLDNVVASSYQLDSKSGSITVDGVSKKLTAYTDFGSINISNANSVTLDVLTKSGSIEFAGSLGDGPHSLHSDFGTIILIIPADSAFNVDLSTDFGQISSNIPMTVSGNIDKQSQVGTLNGGGDELKVKTKSGNIEIHSEK